MWLKQKTGWAFFAALLLANLSLLLPNSHPLRVAGALLLVGLLPGLGWSRLFFFNLGPLAGWTLGAALSTITALLATLLLHNLPGPIELWHLLLALNSVALPPLFLPTPKSKSTAEDAKNAEKKKETLRSLRPLRFNQSCIVLLLILLVSLFLRAANLHYSEFQGDEALAMITAAEAIEGHDDALFLRSKGPGEVLLPLAMWRLTGTITEATARLPFTVAALLAIVTIFLIGRRLAGDRLGWLAAAFFAFNGFMVAFGRIVQYQALVVWFSALAVLLALAWRQRREWRWPLLAGLCLGAGLLAHYDAVLALPAVVWLLAAGGQGSRGAGEKKPLATRNSLFAILLFAAGLLLVAAPFYLPFALDPQANRTGEYVGGRIGTELRNNLPDFLHFNSFYSSFYFIALTGLLVLAGLWWLLWPAGRGWRIAAGLATAGVAAVVVAPGLLAFGGANWSIVPFALLPGLAFLALFRGDASGREWQAVVLWLAAPFLGYAFVVALGLTHIYTVVPAWSLLAAAGWDKVAGWPVRQRSVVSGQSSVVTRHSSLVIHHSPFSPFDALLIVIFALSTLFLWNAFVRHDVEYWQDYPAGNLALFYTPFEQPPAAGFFGFAHRAGWKALGQKIADGTLAGDYGSNEEPDVTTWYTRGAPRACDPLPEFYFLADDLIDPVELPADILDSRYQPVGQLTQANGKRLQILQQTPVSLQLDLPDEAALAAAFDAGATPAAFARSARGSRPADANFGNLVRLIGFDLDARRATPGGRVPVTLYWQALAPIGQSWQVFTHLESGSGPVAQSDGVPVCWTYPTDAWRPGQIIADQHAIALPPDIAPGSYPLEIGLYLPDTFQRLDVLDVAGNPAGVSVTLAEVDVRSEE